MQDSHRPPRTESQKLGFTALSKPYRPYVLLSYSPDHEADERRAVDRSGVRRREIDMDSSMLSFDPNQIPQLAHVAVAALTPYLPEFLKGASKEVGTRATEAVLAGPRALWSRLHPAVAARPAALEAAHDLVSTPDSDHEAALRVQLIKLLNEDHTLAAEIAHLLTEHFSTKGTTTITQTAGDHAFQVGQAHDVSVNIPRDG